MKIPPRPVRVAATLLFAISLCGILVFFDLILANDLWLIPFLLIGYLALELISPYLSRDG